MLYKEITEKIIRAFYTVNNAPGFEFLEKVYENSMAIEQRKFGLKVEKQNNVKVFYDGQEINT